MKFTQDFHFNRHNFSFKNKSFIYITSLDWFTLFNVRFPTADASFLFLQASPRDPLVSS